MSVAIDFGKAVRSVDKTEITSESQELAEKIKVAKREFENAKALLDTLKDEAREIAADKLSPTCKAVAIGPGVECRFVAAYRTVPAKNAPALCEALGEDIFNMIFDSAASLKAKSGANIAKFVDACRKKKIDLDSFFEVSEVLKPVTDFTKICKEEIEKDSEKKDAINSVERQVRYEPRVHIK